MACSLNSVPSCPIARTKCGAGRRSWRTPCPRSLGALLAIYWHLQQLDDRINGYDRELEHIARASEAALRLMTVPGVGPLTALATLATVGHAHEFASGRQFAAWLGLVPKQWSTGGKSRLGHITRHGDAYVRTLLIMGARAALQGAGHRSDKLSRWGIAVKERCGYHKAVVALAAKNARILWALLTSGSSFKTA